MHCNTQLLESKIKQSGLKIGYIAERLGITQQGLHKKRTGEIPFKHLEIQELQKLLNLSDNDVANIFLL